MILGGKYFVGEPGSPEATCFLEIYYWPQRRCGWWRRLGLSGDAACRAADRAFHTPSARGHISREFHIPSARVRFCRREPAHQRSIAAERGQEALGVRVQARRGAD